MSAEQAEELEVLASIFPDELEILSSQPTHKFKVKVAADADADGETCYVFISLVFNLPAKYPDVAPQISIEPIKKLNPSMIAEVTEIAERIAQENIGSQSIFQICEAVKEWAVENNREDAGKEESILSQTLRQKEKELLQKDKKTVSRLADSESSEQKTQIDKDEQERQRKRQAGTQVTVDSFLKWKAGFDKEMAALKAATIRTGEGDDLERPSGKQMFLMNKDLGTSDVDAMARALEGINELEFDFEGMGVDGDEDEDYFGEEGEERVGGGDYAFGEDDEVDDDEDDLDGDYDDDDDDYDDDDYDDDDEYQPGDSDLDDFIDDDDDDDDDDDVGRGGKGKKKSGGGGGGGGGKGSTTAAAINDLKKELKQQSQQSQKQTVSNGGNNKSSTNNSNSNNNQKAGPAPKPQQQGAGGKNKPKR